MGWILRRYVLSEVLAVLGVGLLATTFVLATVEMVDLVDLAFAKGVAAWRVATIFAYMVPSYLELTLPMALLLSIVASLARLTRDGEMLAFRSAGVSLWQLCRPIFALAAVVSALTFALAAWVSPRANAALEAAITEMAKTRMTAALTPGVFSSWIDGVVVYVAAIERRTGRIKDAMVADNREEARPRTIFAARGRLVTDDKAGVAHFLMHRGTILENESVRSYDRTDFKMFELNVSLATEAADAGSEIEEPRRLQWGALRESRRSLVARGEAALEQEIEIQRRLAVSFVCVLLPLIGVPLGVQPARSARSRGTIVALGVISGYYFLLTTAVTLVHKQLVGVVPALWAPDVALFLAGCAALWRAATEHSHEGRTALRSRARGAGA